MILWTFLSAFLGALVLLVLPASANRLARSVALVTSLAGLAVAVVAAMGFDQSPSADDFQYQVIADWIPAAGIGFHMGVDGISLAMILLTGVVAVAGVLFSWNVTQNPGRFFALFFLIIGGAYGVFLSLDVFLLLVFYEIVILPKYLLIAGWGSTNKEYGAMKLTMYSIFGSALALAGVIAAHIASGTGSFNWFVLAGASYAPAFQAWAFPLLFLGFAVLAGLWPFHTWAPTGHVAAPTAASMLLAGVVMKLGSYAVLRVALPLFPEGLRQWQGLFAALAAVGILYGALAALAQRDLKFVIGYSSISHMGFVMLGLVTFSMLGVTGGILQMVSHGVIASLLFAVVGRMIYDRTHTRDFDALRRMRLARALPFAALAFTIASVASMGLPGFSGFIAELTVLLGTWASIPWLLWIVAPGIVVTVAFTLRALVTAFFVEDASRDVSSDAAGGAECPALEPITWPEKLGTALLVVSTLWIGLFPGWLIALIQRALEGDIMRGILQ